MEIRVYNVFHMIVLQINVNVKFVGVHMFTNNITSLLTSWHKLEVQFKFILENKQFKTI